MERVIRRYACAAGRVQGVGFRMFVRQQAVMNDITGWVMNMSDGTVTMELQGDAAAVEAAFDAMRTGNYFIRVERLDIEEREPVDGERDFSIRY
nr:acylphosphatase [uncultured Selenomonas sp.]